MTGGAWILLAQALPAALCTQLIVAGVNDVPGNLKNLLELGIHAFMFVLGSMEVILGVPPFQPG